MDKQTETFYDHEGHVIPQRYIELWEAHNKHPVNEKVWSQVIDLAQKEEGTQTAKRSIYGKVPLKDLLDLAQKVRIEKNSAKRYKLVAEEGPSGKIWFDILIGLSNEQTIAALAEGINKQYGHGRFLDIGTGTGKLAEAAKDNYDEVIMLDQADFLLKIAQDREYYVTQKNKYAMPVAANALHLPFKDQSIHVAVSHGLTNSFTREELKTFAKEVNRVLEDNHGTYYDSFVIQPEGDLQVWEQKSLVSAKGILADLIVDTVSGSGRMRKEDQVSGNEFIQIFRDAGLTPYFDEYPEHQTLVVRFNKAFYKTPHGLSQHPS